MHILRDVIPGVNQKRAISDDLAELTARPMSLIEFQKLMQDPRALLGDLSNKNIIDLGISTKEVYPNPETELGEIIMKDCRRFWQPEMQTERLLSILKRRFVANS